MELLQWTGDRPELRHPTLVVAFEGWNDAGESATTAANHVCEQLKAVPFAKIDPEIFYDFTTSRPHVSLTETGREIVWPHNEFSAITLPESNNDLLVLVGTEPQLRWRTYAELILQVIEDFDVQLVVSLGSLITDVVHSRPSTVYSAGYDPELIERLDLEPSNYEGPSGIVGVLHDTMVQNNRSSVSLWSSIPSYVPHANSPKAALALVKRVGQILDLKIPHASLEAGATAYENQINQLIDEDKETREYVSRLEEAYDSSMSPESGAELIEELEKFLRDR